MIMLRCHLQCIQLYAGEAAHGYSRNNIKLVDGNIQYMCIILIEQSTNCKLAVLYIAYFIQNTSKNIIIAAVALLYTLQYLEIIIHDAETVMLQ